MNDPQHGVLNTIPIRHTHLSEAVQALIAEAVGPTGGQAHRLVNSYTISLADTVPAYQRLLRERGVNLPDGRPVVTVLRRLSPHARIGQVRGPSLFEQTLDLGRAVGLRHFFLGGSADLLGALVGEARRRHPGIVIAGTHSPPFRPLSADELRAQDALVSAADPHIVWVGLGTPKQDFEAQRITDTLGLTTAGVGAAFDFLAGTKPQAPAWMRRLSMEWTFRLASEPARLWRRYLFGNARFLLIAARSLTASRPAPAAPTR